MKTKPSQYIEAVRRFNRFYTRKIGLLQEGMLKSPFTLAEARVIYELAHHQQITATELNQELRLNAGYLSRILTRLKKQSLICKKLSDSDARKYFISLTAQGQKAFSELNATSHNEIGAMLNNLSVEEQLGLAGAMLTIERLLDAQPELKVPYILRPHQSGDMGWVVQRNGVVYNQEYGWDEDFEALVAEIVAGFIRNYNPKIERCWIAERDGKRVGSVFLVQKTETEAQLRLLFVEPKARGLGIGKRLVHECTRFAKQVGYDKIMLWTNSVLDAARHIYEQEGYQLFEEEPHHSFGHDLVGQNWELGLKTKHHVQT